MSVGHEVVTRDGDIVSEELDEDGKTGDGAAGLEPLFFAEEDVVG
jgi:hypothetical protein